MRTLMSLVALSLLVSGAQVPKAFAVNNGQWDDSRYASWYAAQYNSREGPPQSGGWCCNLADGHPFYGNYSLNLDGSMTLEGKIVIDAYKVLDGTTVVQSDGSVRGGPNPTGHAIIWYYGEQIAADNHNVYCASPGASG